MKDAFILSLQLAAVTTLVLLMISIPLAWWFAFGKSRWRNVIEPLTNLPLVLPPTVLGFYLLMVLGLNHALGRWLNEVAGIQLVFSFEGLVVGSVIFSLPFMLQPLLGSFRQLNKNLIEASRCMGKNEWQILQQVILPLSRSGVLAGVILSFAHTIGEFGVVLMVGGNIPAETRTVSIAIFNEVDKGNYSEAHLYALILLGFAFATLFSLRWLQHRAEQN